MEARELSGLRMSKLLGWSQARVSRLLNGRRGVKPADVASFLAICMVTGPERDRLVALAEEQHREDWLQQYGDRLPPQLRTYIDHEVRATFIRFFAPLVLPGILQTEDYARALLRRNANVPEDEIEGRVRARLARQEILSQIERPNFEFYIHEFVLWLQAGSAEIMSEQLHHLLRVSVRKGVHLHVVPRSFGMHGGQAGAFILLSSDTYMPVVYLEGETSGTFLEKPKTIAAYRNVLGHLAEAALDEGQSRELIGNVAVDLYASTEDGNVGE